jgi:hypothetical protein
MAAISMRSLAGLRIEAIPEFRVQVQRILNQPRGDCRAIVHAGLDEIGPKALRNVAFARKFS